MQVASNYPYVSFLGKNQIAIQNGNVSESVDAKLLFHYLPGQSQSPVGVFA